LRTCIGHCRPTNAPALASSPTIGEAGALHLFGLHYGLPPAISAHQNHFFWNPPDFKGENLIVLQVEFEEGRASVPFR